MTAADNKAMLKLEDSFLTTEQQEQVVNVFVNAGADGFKQFVVEDIRCIQTH